MPDTVEQNFDSRQLARAVDAYIWGFPRMLYAKYLRDMKKVSAPFNRFLAMDRMATPDHGGVNVDTLYGVAWFDLAEEPVVIDIPDARERYYSIALIDVHANNFAYVGRRTTGTAAQKVLLAGPAWHGNKRPGMALIRAPSNGVFAFLRTLIDDEADVAIANEFDRGLCVAPLSAYPQGSQPTLLLENLVPYFPHAHSYLDRLGAKYFDHLCDALASDPPTHRQDIDLMRSFAEIGIAPGNHPTEQSPERAALLAEAVRRGHEMIFAAPTSTANQGWAANWKIDAGCGDPLFKAAINRFGIGALNIEECLYLMPAPLSLKPGDPIPTWASFGPDGQPLSGEKSYRLHFAPGQLPQVDAFWSLTMYDAKLFLVKNPIARYAIGDRTKGLVYGDDGSLELLIQQECPASGSSNWLPAPAGKFNLFFRAYQPRPAFLRGDYLLPPLEIVP